MAKANAEKQAAEAARVKAEQPFRDFSMDARVAEMRAAGHVFHSCDPNDVPPEGFDMEAHVKASRERAKAMMAEAHERMCFVGCGHRPAEMSSGTRRVQKD